MYQPTEIQYTKRIIDMTQIQPMLNPVMERLDGTGISSSKLSKNTRRGRGLNPSGIWQDSI